MAQVKEKKKKSAFRIWFEYINFKLLYQTIHALPLKTGYAISRFLVRILFFCDRRHERRTIQHLIHGGAATDVKSAMTMARASYDEFSKLLVEIVKMDQLYDPKKISVTGPEATLDYLLPERNNGSRQIILVTAHLGNWEVAGTAFAQRTQTPMFSLMRPFENPKIGELILAHRRSDIHILIDKRLGIRPVLKALNSGRTATMLIDQHAARSEGIDCIFFGHPARVHMTPALLHLKTGVPIMPELTVRDPGSDFRFTIRVGELIRYEKTGDKEEDVRRLTQRCVTALEKLICEIPVQWLWTSRHWLDLNRREAAGYRDWTPPQANIEERDKEFARSQPLVTVDSEGKQISQQY